MVVPISKNLADYIKPYLSKPEFRQMVMHLLGEDFVIKYLNDLPYQPVILVCVWYTVVQYICDRLSKNSTSLYKYPCWEKQNYKNCKVMYMLYVFSKRFSRRQVKLFIQMQLWWLYHFCTRLESNVARYGTSIYQKYSVQLLRCYY